MAVYSFLDVQASIVGPGGTFAIGSGAGAAEEGITVNMTEDKNTMTIGADGSGMHSLHAGKSGTVTVRLLKTSPTNSKLSALYNFQTAASINHGLNTITVSNPAMGDIIICSQAAFKKFPDNKWSKDGNILEWEFDVISIIDLLGNGSPTL